MNDFMVYIFKSSIWITVFYGIYRFFFRNETFFRFNRTFLLTGMVASFVLALCQLHYPVEIMNFSLPTTDSTPATINDTMATHFDWMIFFLLIYIAVSLTLFLYYGFELNKVWRLIQKLNTSSSEKSNLIYTSAVKSPFSFFGYVFMNPKSKLQDIEKELILTHETAHVEQHHWIDILLAQLVCVLQWFNPFAWLYLNAVKQNHEFLADRSVIENGYSPAVYQAVLINSTFNVPVFTFTNPFASINKFKRIAIMKKNISKPVKKLAVLLLLPAFAGFLAAFAKPEYHYSVLPAQSETETSVSQDSIQKTEDTQTSAKAIARKSPKTIQTINVAGQVLDTDGKPISGAIIVQEDESSESDKNSESVKIAEIKNSAETVEDTLSKKNPLNIVNGKYTTCDDEETKYLNMLHPTPLVLVDGKEYSSSINDLNPADIESISILKDKSATSMYGERGKNGVIIIKTKKATP